MDAMVPAAPRYEARYTWNGRAIRPTAGAVVVVVLPGAGARASRAVARTLTPVSGDMLLASRAVNSWRLDAGRKVSQAGA
jgi:hypothetical protein